MTVHTIQTNYQDFEQSYIEIERPAVYWDRLLFDPEMKALVLHTAHDHTIYVGSALFVDTATKASNNYPSDRVSVIGNAFYDPELISEYGLAAPRAAERK